jgi:hypothetical protein
MEDTVATESDEAGKDVKGGCMYNRIDETQLINVKGGFMTCTKHFKYLGSHISYSSKTTMTSSPTLQQPLKRLEH